MTVTIHVTSGKRRTESITSFRVGDDHALWLRSDNGGELIQPENWISVEALNGAVSQRPVATGPSSFRAIRLRKDYKTFLVAD